jgi:4-amino-4-deoxy-L-arabinose transferase-like glycosyltransferase
VSRSHIPLGPKSLSAPSPSPRWEWFALALILLVALFLRLYRLDTVPPGLTHDEAGNGQSALGVLEGQRPVYFTIGNGREPLYAYSMAPIVAFLGPTTTAVRLTSVLWGLALILLTWAWVRDAFDPSTALLAAAALSLGFWPLMVSRLGLRAVTLPVLFTAAVYFLWRAMGLKRADSQPGTLSTAWPRYILAGLLLGASFYTYMASRVLPAIPLVFLAYLALWHRPRARSTWPGLLVTLLIALLVALPLVRYLSAHPDAETRIEQLVDPWRRALDGDWQPLRHNVVAALKIFTFSGAGDPHWIYNISGRPLLDPLSGVLFYTGLALAIWRWRDPAHFFALAWLVIGLVPVLVTGANSSVMRAIAAQPVVFLMPALALRELATRLRPRSFRVASVLLPGLLLLVIAAITVRSYFDRWPDLRDVRVAYHTTLVETGRYLDAESAGGTAIISSIYPGYFHDPYTFDLASHRDDLQPRWFDGRYALLFPDVKEAYAVFPALAPLDAALEPYFTPHAHLLDRVTLRADDLNPWFEVYRLQPRAASAQLPLAAPIDVGHVVAFVGHQLLTPTVAPGGTVELLTFWRVLDPTPIPDNEELVLFTHVLDDARQVAGQQDRLDVPAWDWASGDLFVQLHRFALKSDLADGLYPLEIGLYSRAEGYPRLLIYQASGTTDSIPLPPVEVRTP